MNHTGTRNIDSQDLMCNLRKGGLHPLAVRMHTNSDIKPSIWRQTHHRLVKTRNNGHPPRGKDRRAMGRLLGVGCDTEPDQPSIGLAPLLSRPHRIQVNHF